MIESKKLGLSPYKMAGRIQEREDNQYKKEVIYDVLKMYMDEVQKALLRGERIQIKGVGTIIPELKVHARFNLPCCNRVEGNPPYTSMRMSRTNTLKDKMDQMLLDNLDKNVYGLEKLGFTKQQMTYLKNGGFVSEDIEVSDYDDEEE